MERVVKLFYYGILSSESSTGNSALRQVAELEVALTYIEANQGCLPVEAMGNLLFVDASLV
jgi:hypothetical protein